MPSEPISGAQLFQSDPSGSSFRKFTYTYKEAQSWLGIVLLVPTVPIRASDLARYANRILRVNSKAPQAFGGSSFGQLHPPA
jgi:hypothetical protein